MFTVFWPSDCLKLTEEFDMVTLNVNVLQVLSNIFIRSVKLFVL